MGGFPVRGFSGGWAGKWGVTYWGKKRGPSLLSFILGFSLIRHEGGVVGGGGPTPPIDGKKNGGNIFEH